ncbi:MAG: PRC-barrel domain-containing protein [Sphingomonadaceae bacterium]
MSALFDLIAPAATMAGAILTAANLGARVTGWGFVAFTIGSLGWCMVALASGQQSLLLTNGFLVVVNIVGVWRWLGHLARYEDGARAAEAKSARAATPTLVAVTNLVGCPVVDPERDTSGSIVGIMAEEGTGKIAYAVVRARDPDVVGDRLIAIGWQGLSREGKGYLANLQARDAADGPTVNPDDWPTALA